MARQFFRPAIALRFQRVPATGTTSINRSDTIATYLEFGSRQPEDLTTCSDVDMKSSNADGRFVRKDGTSYSSL